MITDGLYEDVLINPITRDGSNNLYAVSGYASATFANRHLSDNKKFNLTILLFIITLSNHPFQSNINNK